MISNNLDHLLIKKDASVLEAIKAIDNGAKQIAFVVNEEGCLIGAVTDGDIRRGLLQNVQLNDSVQIIMKKDPLKVKDGENKDNILEIMHKYSVHQIPVVSEDGKIVRIEWIDDLITPKKKEDTWIVLMAGGLGTRLRPLTQHTPKPMLPVGGRPLLENIIRNFVEQGYRRFFLSVNYKAEMVRDYFGDGSAFDAEISYLEEDKRLGTAGALSLLPNRPHSPIIVMNGDLLTAVNFQYLLKFHAEHDAVATICAREYSFQVPYGVMETEGSYLTGIVEKPMQRFLVNSGIYVVSPEALDFIPQNQYFDMPQLFDELLEKQQKTSVFPIHEYWLDIGRFDDLEKAQGEFHEVFSK